MKLARITTGVAAAGLAALMALGPSAAKAQTPTLATFSSSIQVQNLSSSEATITLDFYSLDDTDGPTPVQGSIAGNGQVTYATLPDAVGTGFSGSAVISSNQQIAAIVNIVSPDLGLAFGGEAYVGVTQGSTSVSLPLLFKDSFQFDSFFNVQNVGQTATNVTVEYRGGGLAAPFTTAAVTLQPGAAHRFDQGTEANLPSGFNGSAIVRSTGAPIAAVVSEVGSNTVLIYNGFAAGTTDPSFPLINTNNFGYVTGISLQNTGDQNTNVTVAYSNNTGEVCRETLPIAAGGTSFFAINSFAANDPTPNDDNCGNGATFVGSARVVTNSASQPLVAVVNQLNGPAAKGGSYSSFDPAAATDTVVFPLIQDRNFGYFTGISIANVGGNPVSVRCTYSNTTYEDNFTLAANASSTIVHGDKIRATYNGSGSCVATPTGGTDARIVGIANQLNNARNANGTNSDKFFVYEGTNN